MFGPANACAFVHRLSARLVPRPIFRKYNGAAAVSSYMNIPSYDGGRKIRICLLPIKHKVYGECVRFSVRSPQQSGLVPRLALIVAFYMYARGARTRARRGDETIPGSSSHPRYETAANQVGGASLKAIRSHVYVCASSSLDRK